MECLWAPYFVLYVLHTPRGEGKPGRYQSLEKSGDELERLIETYSELLQSDARFDLRVHSPHSKRTVVGHRHNLICVYGLLERYQVALSQVGCAADAVDANFPHMHHRRAERDSAAQSWLGSFDWAYSPLRLQNEK